MINAQRFIQILRGEIAPEDLRKYLIVNWLHITTKSYLTVISRSFGSSQKIPAVAWRMRVRNKPGLHSFEEEGPDFVVGGDGYGEVRGVQLDNFIDVLPGVCTRNRPLATFQVYIHPVGIVPSFGPALREAQNPGNSVLPVCWDDVAGWRRGREWGWRDDRRRRK